MITLPSPYTTNLAAGRLAYVIRLTVLDGGTAKYLYLGNHPLLSSLTVQYSGSTVEVHLESLAALVYDMGSVRQIQGMGEMEYSIPLSAGGGVSGIGGASFVMINQANYGGNVYQVEGQPIEIWEGYLPANGTLEITTAMTLRFKGITDSVGRYDHILSYVQALDRRERDRKLVPAKTVQLAEFPSCPNENIGKVMPIVIGQFFLNNDATLGGNNLIPTFMVDRYSNGFLFCGHDIDVTSAPSVWCVPSAGVSGVVGGTHTLSHTSARTLLTMRGQVWVDFYHILLKEGYLNTQTDFFNAVNGDSSTYADVAASGILAVQVEAVNGIGDAIPHTDPRAWDVTYDISITVETSARTGTPKLYWRNITSNAGWTELATINAALVAANIAFASAWDWSTINNIEVSVQTDGSSTCRVTNLFMHVRSTIKNLGDMAAPVKTSSRPGTGRGPGTSVIPSAEEVYTRTHAAPTGNIFAQVYGGILYGSWITGRGGGTSGERILQSAYAIEWILRTCLGLVDADIDMTSFDAVGNTTDGTRKDWEIAGVILEQRDAFEIIRQICFEFSLMLYLTTTGKYKLVPLDSASSVYTITTSDIATENGIPQISVDVSPSTDIYNEYQVGYHKNFKNNAPDSSIYVADTDDDAVLEDNLSADSGAPDSGAYTDWCQDSIDQYRLRQRLTVDLEFVREAATAELAMKKFMDWFTYQRLIVTMVCVRNANTLALEVGDIVTLNLDIIRTIHKSAPFMIRRINYPPFSGTPPAYLTIEVEEMPNANTGVSVVTDHWIRPWGQLYDADGYPVYDGDGKPVEVPRWRS